MPPKRDKEVVFFLAGVGENAGDTDPKFFDQAKEVMTLIIEKKIFLRPNDEVGIMLSAHTDDDTSEESCTKLYWSNLTPSWKMVKDVQKLRKSNKVFCNWNTALWNTIQQIEETVEANRVILILIFDCHPSCPNLKAIDPQTIAESIEKLNIQLLWIGSKPLKDLPEHKLNESEKALMEIIKQAKGEYMTMEKTLPSLRIFKKNKSRYMAWKCDLELGSMRIPTSTYVQATAPVKTPSFQAVCVRERGEGMEAERVLVRPERDYVDRYKEAHPIEDTIPGYMYGRKSIPVPEADEAGMEYKAGPKSFKIFAFIPRNAVALEDLGGNSSRIVIPQSQDAAKAFYCLLKAMDNANQVAIVRRVYQLNNCPKMNVLIPHIVQGEPWCFVLVELLYAEDRRVQLSRALSSVKKRLTKEKDSLVGDLIDSMMLNSSDEEKFEPFCPGTVHSPRLQHFYNCLSQRALKPEMPLPEMEDNLRKLIDQPDSVKNNSEAIIEKLKSAFPILNEEISTKKAEKLTGGPVALLSDTRKIEDTVKAKMEDLKPLVEQVDVDLDELLDADLM